MKKRILFFFVMLLSLTLVACNNEKDDDKNVDQTPKEVEYVYNGTFTAFESSFHADYMGRLSPQLTWVSVTVNNGEIESFYIDEVQSSLVDGIWQWNAKTKKQLKEDYGMVGASPIGKEWYEQAEYLENYFLAHGAAFVEYDGDGNPLNGDLLTGTTMIIDTYTELALKAVANWKQGKYTALNYSMNRTYVPNSSQFQYTWVDLKVVDGKISEFYIDTVQSNVKVADNEFSWNKSKKVLGYDYGMVGASPIGKEWFEQAEVLEDFFLNRPISDIILDSGNYVQNVTGVSMVADTYMKLAIKTLNYFEKPTEILK